MPDSPCTASIDNDHSGGTHHCILGAGHRDPEFGSDHAGPVDDRGVRYRWSDHAVGAVPHQDATPAVESGEEPLARVGWWCWRGDNHGHLATEPCRSDNVPIHVPAEWADEMRAVIQRIEDGDDEQSAAPAVSSPLPDQTLRDRIASALPEALEAALTKRFTELGNQFAEMRVHEQGPDGWPSSRLVSPHMVAEVLREELRSLAAEAQPETKTPANPVATLLDAAASAERLPIDERYVHHSRLCDAWDDGREAVARLLRRLAAEAPQGSEVERLQEQLEESENTAEQLVRNVQTVARERESYRKAWKEEQQRRAKTVAEVRKVAEGLEGDAAAPGVVEIVRPALRDAARQIRAALDGAEAQQPDTRPRRGDQFEAWLKAQRDAFGWQGANRRDMFDAFDNLLDLYRLHADTGTPLGERVCEGEAIGDCGCLEPAADGSGEEARRG